MSPRTAWTDDRPLAPAMAVPPCAWLARGELVERCLGNVELAERVLRRFRDGLDEALLQLRGLLIANDLAGVARRAHRLRGEAANVGAERISQQAALAEQFATEGRSEAAGSAVEQLIATGLAFRERVRSLHEADE